MVISEEDEDESTLAPPAGQEEPRGEPESPSEPDPADAPTLTVEQARSEGDQAYQQAIALDPHFAPHASFAFERLGKLGQGGMGVVYRVRDDRLGREAALKVMRSERASEDDERRFWREAVITSHLNHPAIPPVFEAGTNTEGAHYMLMKVIEGEPLSNRIADLQRSKRPEPGQERDLLEALVKVSEAVAYAHSRSVVHRDLKPSNVMVGAFGDVMVVDWGLARVLDWKGIGLPPEEVAGLERITQVGATMGTPGYMSPEQAGGDAVDAASDVFALGAVLACVLTGKPPVSGETPINKVHAAIEGRILLPKDRRPSVSAELNSIAARALAVRPQDRYPSAEAFAQDLRAFLTGDVVSSHHYTARELVRRFGRGYPTLLVGASLTVVAALVVTLALHLADAARTQADLEGARAEREEARAESERVKRNLAEGSLRDKAKVDEVELNLRRLESQLGGLARDPSGLGPWRTKAHQLLAERVEIARILTNLRSLATVRGLETSAHGWRFADPAQESAHARVVKLAAGLDGLAGRIQGLEQGPSEDELKAGMGGDPEAMVRMGHHYALVVGDQVKAREWYARAAKAGSTEAMFSLGSLYESGPDQDLAEAARWYRKAGEAGNRSVLNRLGYVYSQGRGVERDFEEAERWYRLAAEGGDAVGWHNLASLYVDPSWSKHDYLEAARCYEEAIAGGYVSAQTDLSNLYMQGLGVERDPQRAVELLTRAADAGSSLAMGKLGNLYLFGAGVEEDLEEGVRWHLKAAEAGELLSFQMVGVAYQNGIGVPPDLKEAETWYLRGAQAGNFHCMAHLGELYMIREDGDRSFLLAEVWLKRAAESGIGPMVFGLAALYCIEGWQGHDYSKAATLLAEAGKAGGITVGPSKFALATLRFDGLGLDRDLEGASSLFLEVAKLSPIGQDMPMAQFSQAVTEEFHAYAALYAYLAGRELGREAEARALLVKQRTGGISRWRATLVAFLLGEVGENELFAAAEDDPASLCEAGFYAGALKKLTGDEGAARALLQGCVETGQSELPEHRSARAMLKRWGGD